MTPNRILLASALLLSTASGLWVEDAAKKSVAMGRVGRDPAPVPKYAFDLDAPPQERWAPIAKDFTQYVPDVLAYLHAFLPPWAAPIVEAIAGDLTAYFPEYGDEMIGAAKALGMKTGDIVLVNLVYQIEHLGINCSNWNNTGPTVPDDPGCMAVDPNQEWCFCKAAGLEGGRTYAATPRVGPDDGPGGPCTSVVAQASDGTIWHGRNLDWNLPPALRKLVVDVDYRRGNETLFTATTFVGFSGVLNGIRRGAGGKPGGWTVSMDARGKGGKILYNLIEALATGAVTPSQRIRQALEGGADFASAVTLLSSKPIVNEAYFVVGGAAAGEGVVIARDRNIAADRWYINASETFYRLETNYDRLEPVPVADDRRTPGNAHMDTLGQAGVGAAGMLSVMKQWPTFNHHTDYTGVFSAANDMYTSMTWSD